MKLSLLQMVVRHADARLQLLHTLDALAVIGDPDNQLKPRGLFIAIDGEPQDETILALARPVIEREIRARVTEIERELADLGVEVDGSDQPMARPASILP